MLKKVYKYSATWCAPCKTYAPIFDKVTEEYSEKLEIKKFDVDDIDGEDEDLMMELNIRSIPTTVFFGENNKVLKKIIGSVSETDLKKIIDEELAKE